MARKKNRKKLSEIEMLTMDINTARVDKLTLEVSNLRLSGELDIMKRNDKIRAKTDEAQNCVNKRKEYVDKLKLDLGIESEQWGYDPETGELK